MEKVSKHPRKFDKKVRAKQLGTKRASRRKMIYTEAVSSGCIFKL